MSNEEIVNSQDYKATEAALKWWYSLPEEQRKATDIDAEPDIVDAYADGVIYGWNNPQWISVEEELPTVGETVQIYVEDLDDVVYGALQLTGDWWCEEYGCNFSNITYWMPKPMPPRKEE